MTVAVGIFLSRLGLAAQTAISVAICAVFAWGRPAIQLCLWTPPIVLMTAGPSNSIVDVGFYRGCEVILGGLIGGLLLVGAEKLGALENFRRVPENTSIRLRDPIIPSRTGAMVWGDVGKRIYPTHPFQAARRSVAACKALFIARSRCSGPT